MPTSFNIHHNIATTYTCHSNHPKKQPTDNGNVKKHATVYNPFKDLKSHKDYQDFKTYYV